MSRKRNCFLIICLGFLCLVVLSIIYPAFKNAKTEIVHEVMVTKGVMIVDMLIEHKSPYRCKNIFLLIDESGGQCSFKTSTQFFSGLAKMALENGIKFDYSWVTLNEVSPVMKTKEGRITDKYVMWSIVKNPPKSVPINLPVLLTRNIDVTSLACAVSKDDMKKKIKLDRRFTDGYEDKFACVIYADGFIRTYDISKGCDITYETMYRGMALSCGYNIDIKYLTPMEEVTLKRGE